MSNAHGPAYPVTEYFETAGPRTWFGLTKREAFAMAAMQGIVAADPHNEIEAYRAARWAVELADALLAELAKDNAA